MDLAAALAALDVSSRLLATSLLIAPSVDLVERRYADVRVAQLKVKAAIAEYCNHRRETTESPAC